MRVSKKYIEKIRHFNRFYTQILGLLNNKLLKSDFSLSEARILFELDQASNLVSSDLSRQLHLDPAYLSRILKRFEKQGLLHKKKSSKDTRKHKLLLTSYGKTEISKLQDMSNSQITSSLANATREEYEQLIKAMATIEKIFTEEKPHSKIFTLRPHRPGDIGYIAYRHAVFYSQAYGFDVTFDSYVASGLSKFIMQYDTQKEHLWIAEEGITFAGSIAIVKKEEAVAQLRWFLVEPEARRRGLGKKLLCEAIAFCKYRNYKKIILWTVGNLYAARRLYEQYGFQLITDKSHQIWGQKLTEELWELELNKRIDGKKH